MHTLVACLHRTEPEQRVLAANLLLQLDMLVSFSIEASLFQNQSDLYCNVDIFSFLFATTATTYKIKNWAKSCCCCERATGKERRHS